MTTSRLVPRAVLPPLLLCAGLSLLLLALAWRLLLQTPLAFPATDPTLAALIRPLLTGCLLATSAAGVLILGTHLTTHLIVHRVTRTRPPFQWPLLLCGLTALALGPALLVLA